MWVRVLERGEKRPPLLPLLVVGVGEEGWWCGGGRLAAGEGCCCCWGWGCCVWLSVGGLERGFTCECQF